MLDELLQNKDVINFISELKTNDRYFNKELSSFNNRKITVNHELGLYIFYDALYKYKLILDDNYLLSEYLEQIDKLYKKINNYDEIVEGINKLIAKMVIIKLDIKNPNLKESQDKVIKYVYDKYIIRGYYIHGFNSSYKEKIKEEGFIPEEYENYYDRFSKINKIFAKYNVVNAVEKDFSNKLVTFTDDFLMACYYSTYGPEFFSSFLVNEDYFGKKPKKDGYLLDNFDQATKNLKKFMSNNLFNEEDKKYILDLVKDEWDLLHRRDKKVSLLLVKRMRFDEENIKLEDYLDEGEDTYELVDDLLSSKKSRVFCEEKIAKEDLLVLELDTYYDKEEEIEEEIPEVEEDHEFMDTYGKVSIILIFGALFITLGVIITLFILLGGV